MKTPPLLPMLAAIAIAISASGQDRDERRDEIHKLAERARQAKAAGHDDETNELLGRAKKLEADMGGRGGKKEAREQGGEQVVRMKQEIAELRRAGRHEEAARLQRQLKEDWCCAHGADAQAEKGPAQLRHMMEAIHHLRAAGLNDVAENLEQRARRMKEEFERRDPADKAQAGSPGEIRELRAQVERLAREIEKLRDELKRPRGDAERKE